MENLTSGKYRTRKVLEGVMIRAHNNGMVQDDIAEKCLVSQQLVSTFLSAYKMRGAGI